LDSIGTLLQPQHASVQEIVKSVDSAEPGMQEEVSKTLTDVVQSIETHVEALIMAAQGATQGAIDDRVEAVQKASQVAVAGKTAADDADAAWSLCVAEEQAKRQAAEDAQIALVSAREVEEKACLRMEANEPYKWAAPMDKHELAFECVMSDAKGCEEQLKAFKQSTLAKVVADVKADMAAKEGKWRKMRATCETKSEEKVAAKTTKDKADEAWSLHKENCTELRKGRTQSMCKFGKLVQIQCVAEGAYHKLINATNMKSEHYSNLNPMKFVASENPDSEPDRMEEWREVHMTKCMIKASIEKGTKAPIAAPDLKLCEEQVDFDKQVGKLDRMFPEFDELAGACVKGRKISFHKGQDWYVPEVDPKATEPDPRAKSNPRMKAYPKAAEYKQFDFSPVLDPLEGQDPFPFCSTAATILASVRGFFSGS